MRNMKTFIHKFIHSFIFFVRWNINRAIQSLRASDEEYESHLERERREFAEILTDDGVPEPVSPHMC